MDEETIIIRCSKCGTKNRIPTNRLNDAPVCGKCRSPLQTSAIFDKPIEVTDRTFNEEVLSYPGTVLVDCWAEWCGPCRMIAPLLDQIAKEYSGKCKIAKLNVDENPATASKYSIQSIPTMLFYRRGQLVNTRVGALPKNEIEKELNSII